jgi:type II secretory pathway pseudopilin PulG
MTTFTPPAERRSPPPRADLRRPLSGRRRRAAAFTLTEVLIAASLSAFILAGVLSTFLLLGRAGLNASAYSEMNSRLRVALERFNHDVRLASDVRWQNERQLTLVFPRNAGPSVTYSFESAADPAAPGRFVRQATGAAREVLVQDVAPDFKFRRYRHSSSAGRETPALNDLETRQLEVRVRALRPDARAPSASQLSVSARCSLRNKSAGA